MQNLQNYMMKMNNSKNDNMKYYIAGGIALVLIVILIVLLTNSKSIEGYDYTGIINKFYPSQNPVKTFLRHDLRLNRPILLNEKGGEKIKATIYFSFFICDDDQKAEFDALIEKGEDLSDEESNRLYALRGCKYDKDDRIVFDEFKEICPKLHTSSRGQRKRIQEAWAKKEQYFDWEAKGGKYISFQLEGRPESKKVPIAYVTWTNIPLDRTDVAHMLLSLTEIPDELEFNCPKLRYKYEMDKYYSTPHNCPQWWNTREDPNEGWGAKATAEAAAASVPPAAAGARAIPPGMVAGVDVDSHVYDNVTIRIYDAEPVCNLYGSC